MSFNHDDMVIFENQNCSFEGAKLIILLAPTVWQPIIAGLIANLQEPSAGEFLWINGPATFDSMLGGADILGSPRHITGW